MSPIYIPSPQSYSLLPFINDTESEFFLMTGNYAMFNKLMCSAFLQNIREDGRRIQDAKRQLKTVQKDLDKAVRLQIKAMEAMNAAVGRKPGDIQGVSARK